MIREPPEVESASAEVSAEDAAGSSGPGSAETRKLRILHLEDSSTDAELVTAQLRRAGLPFASERVTTRETFLSALEQFHPDIVLADFLLPDFDGLSAVRLVRERDADLPVIVVTGVLGDEAAVGLMQAGASDYVLKDRLARLATAVKKAVAEAEQSRARRRAEDALRLSEERYRSLIAATAQIVWTTSPWGDVTGDLAGWREYTGQSIEEVRNQGWLNALHPDGREQVMAAWTQAVQAGTLYEGEWRVRRRDGQYRYFSTRAAPLHGANGAIREWIGCNVDITEPKHYQQELERRNRWMKVIKNLSDMLQACISREEAYPFIAIAAEELLPESSGALAVPTAGAPGSLETVTEWGEAHWIAPDFTFEDCWALRRGGMHEPGAGTECHHFRSEPTGPYVCLPLLVRGEISGLLTVCLTALADDELRSEIAAFGDTLALCLANLKLLDTLQKQAIRDSLTGLLSSQYVEEMLPREIRRAGRHRESLSLALLDIDHFQQLNNTHGRAAGDQVLSQIGELLRTGLGAFDLACRHNSEEFLLVLIGDEVAALPRLQRICLEIQSRSFTCRNEKLPPITVSAGLAQLTQPATTAADLIRGACQALHAAQQSGGGRIEAFTAPMP